MSYDDLGVLPPQREIPHYHGDATRALLVAVAVLLVVAEALGADLSVSALQAVAIAVLLVLAAGVTNPAQTWIHIADGVLAALGALFFGYGAVTRYQADGFGDPTSFIFALALAVLSLVALYLSTRTIRGMMLREPR